MLLLSILAPVYLIIGFVIGAVTIYLEYETLESDLGISHIVLLALTFLWPLILPLQIICLIIGKLVDTISDLKIRYLGNNIAYNLGKLIVDKTKKILHKK